MLKKLLPLIILITFPLLAQIEVNSVSPQFSDQKIEHIPNKKDDQDAEKLLREISKKAGWFPEISIDVGHGIVLIQGKAKNQAQLDWLAQTAGKLPTVIAVVNKAELITPPFTDMSPFFNELKHIANIVKKNLPRVVMGLVMMSLFVFIGFKLQTFSRNIWQRRIPNIFLAATIARLVMIPVWVMFFYLALLTIGLQSLAGTIIGGTGILGIVLGFAFKGIAENYLSGILLAIRSPFTKGDAVKIDQVEGIIQNLNMRGTTLMDSDGNLVLVPNITVIQSVVKNLSVNQNKRATFIMGVGFTDSIKQCQDLILEALQTISGICMDPAPMIFVENMGTSTINIRVYFWFNSKESSEAMLKSAAIVKTKELLLAHGMHLPDTAREILLADPLKVQMLSDTKEAETNLEEKKQHKMESALDNFKEAHDLDDHTAADHENELRKIAENISLPTQSPSENLLGKH